MKVVALNHRADSVMVTDILATFSFNRKLLQLGFFDCNPKFTDTRLAIQSLLLMLVILGIVVTLVYCSFDAVIRDTTENLIQ